MIVRGPSPSVPPIAPAESPAVRRAQRPAEAAPAAAPAAPLAAPPHADPELWSVLTSDERAYFVQQELLGSVTYGRGRAAPDAPPVGQRLDVRG